jgi:peptide/nickel transport system substrate-binding protein
MKIWAMIMFSLIGALAACSTTPAAAPTIPPVMVEPPAPSPTVPESGPTMTPGAEPQPTSVPPTVGTDVDTLRIIWQEEPDSLNLLYTDSWFASALGGVYNCRPWLYDENNDPHPSLAAALPKVSANGLVVTLQLREDIYWSDGTPITSADFVFTHSMINHPHNGVAWIYPYDLFQVTAPNLQTVEMTFAGPFAPWMATTWAFLLPKHILQPELEQTGSIDLATWNLNPTVGCGPFVLDDWELGEYLRFKRNPNYWGTPVQIEAVKFHFEADEESRTTAVLGGQIDILVLPPYDDIPAFRDSGRLIVTQASGYNEGWFFNWRETASQGIRDQVVRQAIVMGVDRETNANIRLGVVAPNITFFDDLPAHVSTEISSWQYDPAAAADLLTANGYLDADGDGIREDQNGDPLVITLGSTLNPERQLYLAAARSQLLEIGVVLETQTYDPGTLFASFLAAGPAANGDLDIMAWSDTPAFPDPDVPYWLCSEIPSADYLWGYNYFGCDPTLDSLFQQQILAIDPLVRAAIFQEITQYMHDQVYYLGIWEDPDVWVINPRLTGVKLSGATPFFNINEWEIVP